MQEEVKILAYAICTGFIYAVIYDLVLITRDKIKHTKLIASLEDVAFWVFVTICTFLFILEFNYGRLRGYIFIGILGGAVIHFTILESFLRAIYGGVLDAIIFIVKKTYGFIVKTLRIVNKWIRNVKNMLQRYLHLKKSC